MSGTDNVLGFEDLVNMQMSFAEQEEIPLRDYLGGCRDGEKSFYASAAERMVAGIGKPEIFDTSLDERLGRVFGNKKIRRFKSFNQFFGMELLIETIYNFYAQSSRGESAAEKILYLLGGVGSGKSSLARHLKELLEKNPIYVLKAGNQLSPLLESPLGLYAGTVSQMAQRAEALNMHPRYIPVTLSPWALKRLFEYGGDRNKFSVVKMFPSSLRRIAITVTEPADENNQDVSSLIGKTDITKLADVSQSDPDAYSFTGALNTTTQGIMEFVEMFKASIKTLNPLLQATTEHSYNATESFEKPYEAALPFNGLFIAHSNESEWQSFSENKKNEAFLSRVQLVKVPYTLRYSEQIKIDQQYLDSTERAGCDITPGTLELMAKFAIMTRVEKHENSTIQAKMRVYNGDDVKNTDPKAKPLHEYQDDASKDEGMSGFETRLIRDVISATFDYDPDYAGSNPVFLFTCLEKAITNGKFDKETQDKYLGFIKYLSKEFATILEKDLQAGYVGHCDEFGQGVFDRYIKHADCWIEGDDYRSSSTNQILDSKVLDAELSKIEKPSGISNPKDFRNEMVKFSLRYIRDNDGKAPPWDSNQRMKEVIEKLMFKSFKDLLPLIKFGPKKNKEDEKKHGEFIKRMEDRKYSRESLEVVIEWYELFSRSI